MENAMDYYKAEYIWIDGSEPTSKLRSKTKIVPKGEEPPIWGFDGSSTNQAPGENSDCVLRPVFTCPDPIRGGDDILAMCEVLLTDMSPHPSNTRAGCAEAAEKYGDFDMWFRDRAGVYVLRRHQAAGMAGQRLPRASGRVLLRGWVGRGVRTAHRGSAHGTPASRPG